LTGKRVLVKAAKYPLSGHWKKQLRAEKWCDRLFDRRPERKRRGRVRKKRRVSVTQSSEGVVHRWSGEKAEEQGMRNEKVR